jgi:hypothetical protein
MSISWYAHSIGIFSLMLTSINRIEAEELAPILLNRTQKVIIVDVRDEDFEVSKILYDIVVALTLEY